MKILNYPSSGSYQSLTFSRNRFGQYVRTRAIPVDPSSVFQQAVRARLATAAQLWRTLTLTQREGWSALGEQITRNDSLGQTYTLTGFQCYVQISNNRAAAGDAAVTDAPAHLPPNPLTSLTPIITAASYSVAYIPTPLGAGERAFVSASPQRSAGRTFEGDYRLILVTAAAAASPSVILSAYIARMGTPVVGNRIFTSVQRYLNGFLSNPISTSTIVV